MPDKYVVVRNDTDIAYGPELQDRCDYWLEQVARLGISDGNTYAVKQATIGWA